MSRIVTFRYVRQVPMRQYEYEQFNIDVEIEDAEQDRVAEIGNEIRGLVEQMLQQTPREVLQAMQQAPQPAQPAPQQAQPAQPPQPAQQPAPTRAKPAPPPRDDYDDEPMPF